MDWIHCNSCYTQPSEIRERKFLLTSCGHIYCSECLKSTILQQKCGVCGNQYTTTQLTSKMRPDVQEYFTSPDEFLNKLIQILAFQNGHRMRMIAHLKALDHKYKTAKQEIKRLHDIIRSFQKKLNNREEQIEQLKHGSPTSPIHSTSQSSLSATTPQQRYSQPVQASQLQRTLMTTNRISLPRNLSPNTPLPEFSPYRIGTLTTSTPVSRINCGSATRNSDHGPGDFKSPVSPVSPSDVSTQYRKPGHYSSQSTTPGTPKTPSTPGYSPHLPEPANLMNRMDHMTEVTLSQNTLLNALNNPKRISALQSRISPQQTRISPHQTMRISHLQSLNAKGSQSSIYSSQNVSQRSHRGSNCS
ncbi:zip homologous protein 2-like isoform X1 [Schistocerca cancellata]|uniref:zip homologous protein 2-like isoform X1 n=2 Tax=Schistocerca cancellata TaxID=274614 RepID=UPI0021190A49|nr:zip homologous protein 2-like isoform X1 [Schistocerca cancellata]XP_049788441.1 zip homologous protein 2-like isoform X1 [Schistocerca cancellata]